MVYSAPFFLYSSPCDRDNGPIAAAVAGLSRVSALLQSRHGRTRPIRHGINSHHSVRYDALAHRTRACSIDGQILCCLSEAIPPACRVAERAKSILNSLPGNNITQFSPDLQGFDDSLPGIRKRQARLPFIAMRRNAARAPEGDAAGCTGYASIGGSSRNPIAIWPVPG